MQIIKKLNFAVLAILLLSACSTGSHRSFETNTYVSGKDDTNSRQAGPVKGQSCQTMVLYLFPLGTAPSTAEAIQTAKKQYEGTKYLTDISIDDRTEWYFGYSIECISVEATAYQ